MHSMGTWALWESELKLCGGYVLRQGSKLRQVRCVGADCHSRPLLCSSQALFCFVCFLFFFLPGCSILQGLWYVVVAITI